jgi:transcriptional regulator with XRE-family HTH domain
MRSGLRQEDLGRQAGLSRSVIGRIERGESDGLAVTALDAAARAVGGWLDVRFRWHGEELDRVLDEAHARLVEAVVRFLADLGWDVAVEVTFSAFGERGSIDVLAFHPGRRALLVVEVKSVTPDMQAMLAGIDRKARLAPTLALGRGWHAETVARVLVLGNTRTNRRRLERFARSVSTALPAGSRDVVRWLRDPVGRPASGVWFLSDVHGADRTIRHRHRVRIPRA